MSERSTLNLFFNAVLAIFLTFSLVFSLSLYRLLLVCVWLVLFFTVFDFNEKTGFRFDMFDAQTIL